MTAPTTKFIHILKINPMLLHRFCFHHGQVVNRLKIMSPEKICVTYIRSLSVCLINYYWSTFTSTTFSLSLSTFTVCSIVYEFRKHAIYSNMEMDTLTQTHTFTLTFKALKALAPPLSLEPSYCTVFSQRARCIHAADVHKHVELSDIIHLLSTSMSLECNQPKASKDSYHQ